MSTSNGTNMTLVCTFALTGGAFAFHHAWKFDRCKCLIPRRKDWFRVLLTWMLLMSLLSLAIWASGWTYIKYQLGWMIVPGVGAVPFPNALWTEQYKGYNLPLTFWVNFAYWLQVCLNAEEGLYWYHLMRAVRTPKSASSWLRSSFFYSWIVICLVCGVIQFGVSWIAFEDMVVQSGRMYACGGVIEVIVVLTSSIVIFKFPAFLRDVKNSGAGPEVRARLHFYHEANKVRTFFRLIFSVTLTILGFDALTEAKKINMTPLAADMMQQAAFGAYFLAYIVNVVLYLPRNSYGKAGPRIMVGPADPRANDPAAPRALGAPGGHLASNALMSLLREGGQWDEIDDQAFDQTRGLGLSTPAGGRTASKLFADGAYKFKGDWDDSASGTSGKPVLNHRESDGDLDAVGNAGGMGNKALENWQSPFSVPMVEELPKQLRIVVQREVEHDGEMGAR